MKTGLLLGKFLPLHKGHIALVEFAAQQCDKLIILLCSNNEERIPGIVRYGWLQSTFNDNDHIQVDHTEYDSGILPGTSVSSREASRLWANYLKKTYPQLNVFISSEPYGEYVAEYLAIEHKSFDIQRIQVPVSASAILKNPFAQWDYIAVAARPWFVKKICISGSESTGKSTLAENLASWYNTSFVPEMAREVIGKTSEVVYDDLLKIATLHAATINDKIKEANKILISDTDVNITKSYSKYLFEKELEVPAWIEQANRFDCTIFLDTDCPFVQDGTRLSEEGRDNLSEFHKRQLRAEGIYYHPVGGNWQQRFEKAKEIINEHFFTHNRTIL